jgi:hypothetical protein
VADPRANLRRVVAIVVLWAIVMAAVSFVAGCYGHNCDGDVQVFGRNPGEGRLLSADMWESGPIDGNWIPFPRQRAWVFEIHDFGDRLPAEITPYVSAQANPSHEVGGNFTQAGGNLAEISGIDKGRVVVRNGTCADYFVRVVVQSPPRPPNAVVPEPTDAGTDAETGP